jgi:hypothetical protein
MPVESDERGVRLTHEGTRSVAGSFSREGVSGHPDPPLEELSERWRITNEALKNFSNRSRIRYPLRDYALALLVLQFTQLGTGLERITQEVLYFLRELSPIDSVTAGLEELFEGRDR